MILDASGRDPAITMAQYQVRAAKYDFVCATKGVTWYYGLGICGEAGELAEKMLAPNVLAIDVIRELGDVLWYVAALTRILNVNMDSLDGDVDVCMSKDPLNNAMRVCVEAGKVADRVKKSYRDETELDVDAVSKDLARLMFYAACVGGALGATLSEVAQVNLDKLEDRLQRGTSKGSGDNR